MPIPARILVSLFWLLSVSVALVSWRFLIGGVEASMAFVAHHLEARSLALYAHITLAPAALLLMPFQFWAGLRARRPGLHRVLGRIYVLAILIAAAGGMFIALGTAGGPVAAAGFALLDVLWAGTTLLALWHARRRGIAEHRRWMIRSAALTFAGVTLRLEMPLAIAALGFEAGYPLVAWLCWVPNLILAEWLLLAPARRRLGAAPA